MSETTLGGLTKDDILRAKVKDFSDLDAKVMLLLQGPSGVGKTRNLCTSHPHPVVLDLNNGLTIVRKLCPDIIAFPFYDSGFRESYCGKKVINLLAVQEFLKKDAQYLERHHLLILDSVTDLADEARGYFEKLSVTKKGDIDTYKVWDKFATYFIKLFADLRSLPCDVCVITHEREDKERGAAGDERLVELKHALRSNQLTDISRTFTDYFLAMRKIKVDNKAGTQTSEWVWRIAPDRLHPRLKTRLETNKIEVPASWEIFKQYKIKDAKNS